MHVKPDNPVIVQGDGKVLLETKHARYESARDFIARFAELEASPEHLHTYRISPLSLWNAASSGMNKDEIIDGLRDLSKFDVPPAVRKSTEETIERYGLVKLVPHPDEPEDLLRVQFETAYVAKLASKEPCAKEIMVPDGRRHWAIPTGLRGVYKQRMLQAGWPIEDLAGFLPGGPLKVDLRETMLGNGKPFAIRPYQVEAVDRWHLQGRPQGGHGTVEQWVSEIKDKTQLKDGQVGAYMGSRKEICPVTVATYQILTWRRSKKEDFAHLHLFSDENWGLIIYDEVHLLPAPVFGATAALQGRRRLGLTATLIREDGRQGDVFSLVGPKRYDLPWQKLERGGFIAEATCYEVRVPFTPHQAARYERMGEQQKFKEASVNREKMRSIKALVKKHKDDNILVIGTYVDQLHEISRSIRAPLITGKTPHKRRVELFAQFRSGEINTLVVSKVANFSIDLPDANVAIQVSGTFGSRQEEAQRLGRILRPGKGAGAFFYTVVTKDSKEQDFAMKRQLFLTEQGYRYFIQDGAAA